jgi:AcrR family transcriptional regulator
VTQDVTFGSTDIKGLHETHQARSRRSRDAFIETGFALLNRLRLDEFTISELVAESGRSVGSFYKRFKNKDAFFRALCAAAVAHNSAFHKQALSVELLNALSPEKAMDRFAEVQFDIFTGKTRGVLREALLRTNNTEDDAWTPMRAAGRDIRQRLVTSIVPRLPGHSQEEAQHKVEFCYQLVVGVLQNDLVNDRLPFSSRDGSILPPLQLVLRDHINGSSRY